MRRNRSRRPGEGDRRWGWTNYCHPNLSHLPDRHHTLWPSSDNGREPSIPKRIGCIRTLVLPMYNEYGMGCEEVIKDHRQSNNGTKINRHYIIRSPVLWNPLLTLQYRKEPTSHNSVSPSFSLSFFWLYYTVKTWSVLQLLVKLRIR